jgi:hydroxymethylpyrimidine pyrophosphatase-like HAD family hydrolase
MRRRGLRPEETIAIGDSRGDLEVAEVTGRFFLVANGLEHDSRIGGSFAHRANVTVTEEPMTAGFYEAVVRSLAEG